MIPSDETMVSPRRWPPKHLFWRLLDQANKRGRRLLGWLFTDELLEDCIAFCKCKQTFISVTTFQHTQCAKMVSAASAENDTSYDGNNSLQTCVAVKNIRDVYLGRHRKSCKLYEPCMRRSLNDDMIRHMHAQAHLRAAKKLWLNHQLNYWQALTPPSGIWA